MNTAEKLAYEAEVLRCRAFLRLHDAERRTLRYVAEYDKPGKDPAGALTDLIMLLDDVTHVLDLWTQADDLTKKENVA